MDGNCELITVMGTNLSLSFVADAVTVIPVGRVRPIIEYAPLALVVAAVPAKKAVLVGTVDVAGAPTYAARRCPSSLRGY